MQLWETDGRRPHWRFKLEPATIAWDDLVRGPSHIDCASLSDPVLVREDGSYLYTLPSVVDDVELGITHVIRGEDHVTNTAVQIQLFRALGASEPAFGHHNLLTTASGEGLSKRTGALSITSLRESGIEALAIAALATLTGSSASIHPVTSLEHLMSDVDLAHLSRTPAKFDEPDLQALSRRTLHLLDFESVATRLFALGITDGPGAEPFWLAVRGNLDRLDDAATWWGVVTGVVEPVVEDGAFLNASLEHLPAEPWSLGTWQLWTDTIKQVSGRKGKALFHPLRLALTGRETGPDLKHLLPLIGRAKGVGTTRRYCRVISSPVVVGGAGSSKSGVMGVGIGGLALRAVLAGFAGFGLGPAEAGAEAGATGRAIWSDICFVTITSLLSFSSIFSASARASTQLWFGGLHVQAGS